MEAAFVRPARCSVQFVFALVGICFLAACQRDSEADLRWRLGQWFFLGPTDYFTSQPNCTGAMFEVTLDRPRAGIEIRSDVDQVTSPLELTQLTAFQNAGLTPTELTELSHRSGARTFGDRALAAGSLSRSCLQTGDIGNFLYNALNRPGALIAFDPDSDGLMVLDPVEKRLFYIAGDEW